MTAQGWPGKLVQISASVHRLHGRGDSPFMPEGRSTDTLVVDQVQLTSEVTYRSQLIQQEWIYVTLGALSHCCHRWGAPLSWLPEIHSGLTTGMERNQSSAWYLQVSCSCTVFLCVAQNGGGGSCLACPGAGFWLPRWGFACFSALLRFLFVAVDT